MPISNFSEADHHQWKAIRKHLLGLSEQYPQWQKRHLVANTNFFSQVKKRGSRRTKPGFLGGSQIPQPGFLKNLSKR